MIVYCICYFAILLYFIALGIFMWRKAQDNRISSVSTRRVRVPVAVYMFAWATQVLLYLPAMLLDGYESSATYYYNICFLLTLTINIPVTYWVMYALVQCDHLIRRSFPALLLPELALLVTYICTGENGVIYAGYALTVCAMILLLAYHIADYRAYIQALETEYSDLSGRDVRWCWYLYGAFALQACLYLVLEAFYSTTLEYVYMAFSMLNAAILTILVLRIPALDEAVCQENPTEEDWDEMEKPMSDELADTIRQKLLTFCERPQLYLQQGLTREMLCREIGVNRTYLSQYLRREGKTYYQYINALRIRYAMQLYEQNPTITLAEVASQSGFKSLPTFRKFWQEAQNKTINKIN